MSLPALPIRPSASADLRTMRDIDAHAVVHGTGTFELEAPDSAEMARHRDDVLATGLPWFVAHSDGQVLGYAYAKVFRPPAAYRYCVEDSVYLAPQAVGRGVGRALLAELVARCEAAGARQMSAAIGDSGNHGSIGVHRALAFEKCGVLQGVGWRFQHWLYVVLMQRNLGAGARTAPAGGMP